MQAWERRRVGAAFVLFPKSQKPSSAFQKAESSCSEEPLSDPSAASSALGVSVMVGLAPVTGQEASRVTLLGSDPSVIGSRKHTASPRLGGGGIAKKCVEVMPPPGHRQGLHRGEANCSPESVEGTANQMLCSPPPDKSPLCIALFSQLLIY